MKIRNVSSLIFLLTIITCLMSALQNFSSINNNQHFILNNNFNTEIKPSYEFESPRSASQTTELKILWNKTYGGQYVDVAKSIINSSLGGYAIVGWTNSSGMGDLDIWILRIGEDGTEVWNKTFGSIEEDKGFQIIESVSGGFVVSAQITNTTALYNNTDFSVIRIANNGNLIWHKNYSGPEQTDVNIVGDLGRSIVECTNGDFALAGVTATATGGSDVWFFRISPSGVKKWDQVFHHWYTERCYNPHSLIQCSDGGFALVGYTYNASLSNDVWLIRTNAFGIPIWNKTYGVSSGYERPEALVECDDGGFAISANTQSFGAGMTDQWIIRTDSFGNQLWNKTYGGSQEDGCGQIIKMSDGGFVTIGSTHSFDVGNGDAWITRVDSIGNLVWNYSIGDSYGNGASSLAYLGNDTYIAVGTTYRSGELFQDAWAFKIQVVSINLPETTGNGISGFNVLIILILLISFSATCLIFKKKYRRIF
jgi:hypothetical protein